MQKSLAKLSIFCENTKGFDLFCLFLLINQEKLRKIKANLWIDHVLRYITGRLTHSCSKYMIFKPSKSSFLPSK